MQTAQTVRTVIPVPLTVNRGINLPAAYFAREAFLAGMSPVIIPVETPALVLSVHDLASSSLGFLVLLGGSEILFPVPDLPARNSIR